MDVDSQNITVTKRVFTLSNGISLLRIPIAALLVFLHYQNGGEFTLPVLLLIFAGIFSDYLDGILARKLNQVSELGKALDPICDKLGMLILFSYVVWLGHIPLWFFLFAIGRDLIIMAGSAYVRSRHGKVPMAIFSGKASINVVTVYWVIAFAFPQAEFWLHFWLGGSVIMMLYSFYEYMERFYRIAQGADFN